jgi:hypothetical protein
MRNTKTICIKCGTEDVLIVGDCIFCTKCNRTVNYKPTLDSLVGK